jgi:hypothetical protein
MVRVIKSRRMRWKGFVESARKNRNAHGILIRKSERKGLFGNTSVCGRTI